MLSPHIKINRLFDLCKLFMWKYIIEYTHVEFMYETIRIANLRIRLYILLNKQSIEGTLEVSSL